MIVRVPMLATRPSAASMTSYGSDLILARLQKLHPRMIDLSLGRIERLA